MRNEVKIGLLALIAIGFSIWGFKYIQGSNLFSRSEIYYAQYDDVAGLTVGTPVQISGVNVGSVSDILLDQQSRKVKVEFDIRKGVNIPVGTEAQIKSISVLGEKAISLIYAKPCFGDGDCAPYGTELKGTTAGLLDMFLPESEDGESPFGDIKGQLGAVVDSLEYTLFSPDSDNPIARSTQDLAVTMENLKGATAAMDRLIRQNSGQINRTMSSLESLSGTLASKQDALGRIIDNAENVSAELTQLQIQETMQEINQTVRTLRGTLEEADGAVASLNTVMQDVTDGKGTLGKLLTSDELYQRLDAATAEADTLFSDFQERPYRYVPFKSRRRVLKHDRKDAALEEERSNR